MASFSDGRRSRHLAAFDPDELGGHPDPGAAGAHQLPARNVQSGPASTPPLTFSHSTTTVPLKSAGSDGRRTRTRVR